MKPIKAAVLILTVLTLLVVVSVQRALAAGPDLVVKDPRYCRLYADVAVVAAAFATRVKSHAELKAGVDPIYLFEGQGIEISDRIILIAWSMKPKPREWAIELMVVCHEKGGDLRAFLAEPT
jgi:hypothetical protein